MFRSPFASPVQHPRAAAAYRTIGTQTAVTTASPHQLVVLLFEGFFAAVNRAKGLRARGDIAGMGQALGHAVRIVDEGLKAGLNTRDGGRIAGDLNDLYAYVTLRLTQANLHANEAAMDECLRLMSPLRDAWASIGPQVGS